MIENLIIGSSWFICSIVAGRIVCRLCRVSVPVCLWRFGVDVPFLPGRGKGGK